MKRILSIVLCLVLLCSCAFGALAVPTGDATEVNTGPSNADSFFIVCLVTAVLGGIYLFFKFRK